MLPPNLVACIDFPVTNLTEDSPATLSIKKVTPQKLYACYYEKDWYFGIVDYISI